MGPLERLLVAHGLSQVLQRYARLADERDWAAIGEVFADDATADYGALHLPDRAAIASMLRHHLGGCGPSQHLLGIPEVAFDVDGVTSRVAVRAAHRGAGPSRDRTYDCMGTYHDRWTLTAQGWRILHRRMTVTLEFGSRSVLAAG